MKTTPDLDGDGVEERAIRSPLGQSAPQLEIYVSGRGCPRLFGCALFAHEVRINNGVLEGWTRLGGGRSGWAPAQFEPRPCGPAGE